MNIVVHMLVKNEENFVWYAINSIIDYVDKFIIWDTGSTDKTVGIIRTIKSPKIFFEEKGDVNPHKFAELRNEMIRKFKADWIFILDGDEIWSDSGIKEIINLIHRNGNQKDLIVSKVKMLIGDIYHYQEEGAGKYHIKNKHGHLNIRAIRNIKGLKVTGFFGNEGYVDKNNTDIQNFSDERIIFAEECYLHASHLKRTSKMNSKYKYELGISFPKDYFFPEILFKKRPIAVPSLWKARSGAYCLRAFGETPLKKIKRRLI